MTALRENLFYFFTEILSCSPGELQTCYIAKAGLGFHISCSVFQSAGITGMYVQEFVLKTGNLKD